MLVSRLSQMFDPTSAVTFIASESKNTTVKLEANGTRTREQFISAILASEADLFFTPADGELYAVSSKEIGDSFEKVLETELDGRVSIGGFSASEKLVWGAAGFAAGALVFK